MSAWQEYKKKNNVVRPWDLLNPKMERSTEEQAQKRIDICSQCPELINATKQCKKCGCFMTMKVKLASATCPLQKW